MGIMVFLLGVFALLAVANAMSGRQNRNSTLDQSRMNDSSYRNFIDGGHCNDSGSWGGSDGGGSSGGFDGGGGCGGGDGGGV